MRRLATAAAAAAAVGADSQIGDEYLTPSVSQPLHPRFQ